ncbi:MAG: TadE/TadG family type IV pilus assembly protein [Acidimicrobiia bacterium]
MKRAGGDRGSASVEAAIAVVALLAMAFFVVGALRVVGTGGDVNSAARAGARAAAAEYQPTSAQAAAAQVVSAALADRGVACTDLAVAVLGDLAPGSVVAVDVTCTVDLSDVVLAGFPGSRTVSGHGVEYVDAVRGGA